MLAFDTHSLFGNVPYKMAYTTKPDVLLRSWKKMATVIQGSVSKLYVTFCGAEVNLNARVTNCGGP
jgi:hypothetical protein